MKFSVIISTNEPEVVWSAFRFANASLDAGHSVSVFLINKGVEIGGIRDKVFDVKQQTEQFVKHRGKMLACGTCLEHRKIENVCPVSTMKELVKIVEQSDKIVTFG